MTAIYGVHGLTKLSSWNNAAVGSQDDVLSRVIQLRFTQSGAVVVVDYTDYSYLVWTGR